MLRTKHASYDTFCGLETEFLFAAGIDATLGHATEAQREDLVGDEGEPFVDEEDMEVWRQGIRECFPTEPEQEHPLSNAAHAAWHGDVEVTRRWLLRWTPVEGERSWVGSILDDLERRGRAGADAAAELRTALLGG